MGPLPMKCHKYRPSSAPRIWWQFLSILSTTNPFTCTAIFLRRRLRTWLAWQTSPHKKMPGEKKWNTKKAPDMCANFWKLLEYSRSSCCGCVGGHKKYVIRSQKLCQSSPHRQCILFWGLEKWQTAASKCRGCYRVAFLWLENGFCRLSLSQNSKGWWNAGPHFSFYNSKLKVVRRFCGLMERIEWFAFSRVKNCVEIWQMILYCKGRSMIDLSQILISFGPF